MHIVGFLLFLKFHTTFQNMQVGELSPTSVRMCVCLVQWTSIRSRVCSHLIPSVLKIGDPDQDNVVDEDEWKPEYEWVDYFYNFRIMTVYVSAAC